MNWDGIKTLVVERTLLLTEEEIIATLHDPDWVHYGIPKTYLTQSELQLVQSMIAEGKVTWRRVSHLGQCLFLVSP